MNIKFENVTKTFGVVTALNNVNFALNQGDFTFLVGPSGAGKSTLIRLILNEMKPTSGAILFDEVDTARSKNHEIEKFRRKIGVIFQDYQLIFDKNIEENIALALDINGYPQSEIPSRIDEVINQVNLANRRFLFPSQLSGGELQRAALARAIAIKPEIILADEPTGNLDAENTWNLVKLLLDINNQGTTVLMTTHNLDIVSSLAKNVITLVNGTPVVSAAESAVVEAASAETKVPSHHKLKKHHARH